MKKAYSAPKMTVHGNVEEITQFFSFEGPQDTIFIGGQALGNGKGEKDFNCTELPTGYPTAKDKLCVALS